VRREGCKISEAKIVGNQQTTTRKRCPILGLPSATPQPALLAGWGQSGRASPARDHPTTSCPPDLVIRHPHFCHSVKGEKDLVVSRILFSFKLL